MNKIKTLLIFSYLLVGCADLMTTNIILSNGGGELNPFMAWAQAGLGAWWIIPKLGLTFVIMWLLSLFSKPRHIAFAIVLLASPVLNNFLVISGMN